MSEANQNPPDTEHAVTNRNAGSQSTQAADPFSSVWAEGYDRIWVLRAVGARKNRAEQRHLRRQWIVVSLGPFLLGSVILGLSDALGKSSVPVALMALVTMGAFAAAGLAWRHVNDDAKAIDSLLRSKACTEKGCYVCSKVTPPGERTMVQEATAATTKRVMRFVELGYSNLLQSTCAVVLAAPVGYLAFRANSPLPVAIVMALLAAYSAVVLSNVLMWLALTPTVVLRLNRSGHLTWRIVDPGRTPGIRALAAGYMYAAIFVGLAALAIALPALFGNSLFSSRLTFLGLSFEFRTVLFVFAMILAVWVGAFTQVRLSHLVRQVRLQVMDRILREPPEEDLGRQYVIQGELDNSLKQYTDQQPLEAYETVGAAPNLPYGTILIVEYAAVLLGATLAYVADVATKAPGN